MLKCQINKHPDGWNRFKDLIIMKKIFVVLFLVIITVSVFAVDEQPRIAVVPFNAIGVSERDAQVLSGLFETALVKTNSFSVIEQNQVKEIVDAQAYSMSGCTDEACAIEFGELLSAEQIILGDVSMIGGKYIINAKIIDVQQGKNIKADNVEAANMGDMTSATELLAYKLAGLTFSSGGTVQVAQEFGEVLIETTPSGADIYINGVHKGTSPDLISRIPIGTIRIEAKKDNLYAVKDVTVSAETGQISLQMKEMFGNIFIKSSERNVDVYIDGRRIGELGTGFFERISLGNHKVELRGSDSRWSGEVEVENGKSSRIDAYPRAFGVVSYSLPDGTTAEIRSRNDVYRVRGRGNLDAWADSYSVTVSGGRFETWTDSINVRQGGKVTLAPEMNTVRELEEEFFLNRYDASVSKLEKAGTASSSITPIIREIETIISDLGDSQHRFPELSDDLDVLLGDARLKYNLNLNNEKLASLKSERSMVQGQYDLVAGKRTALDITGWTFLGIGGAGLVTSAITFLWADGAYEDYIAATEADVALEKRNLVQSLDVVKISSLCGGIVFTALSPVFFGSGPEVRDMKNKMKELDFKIAELSAKVAQ